MPRYVLFLRGINVGGIRVDMSELRDVLTGIGCQDVRTWLNTGNVALTDDRDIATLKTVVEQAVGEAFGYDAYVIVRRAAQLAEIVAAWPFGSDAACHRYVVLGGAVAYDDAVAALGATPGAEAVAVVGEDLMWRCPKGSSTTSPVAKVLARKQLRALTTTRNLNTVEKML